MREEHRLVLAHVRGLLCSATPWPWKYGTGWEQGDPGFHVWAEHPENPAYSSRVVFAPGPYGEEPTLPDVQLIADAPEQLERLVRIVEQLDRELQEAQRELAAAQWLASEAGQEVPPYAGPDVWRAIMEYAEALGGKRVVTTEHQQIRAAKARVRVAQELDKLGDPGVQAPTWQALHELLDQEGAPKDVLEVHRIRLLAQERDQAKAKVALLLRMAKERGAVVTVDERGHLCVPEGCDGAYVPLGQLEETQQELREAKKRIAELEGRQA